MGFCLVRDVSDPRRYVVTNGFKGLKTVESLDMHPGTRTHIKVNPSQSKDESYQLWTPLVNTLVQHLRQYNAGGSTPASCLDRKGGSGVANSSIPCD